MLKTRSPLYIKFPENAPITAPNKKLFLFNEIFENLKKIFAKKSMYSNNPYNPLT
jgi:hypothetical protein